LQYLLQRKFNIYKRENVLPQLIKNQRFPQAITQYITQSEISSISPDVYFILAEIFNYNNFQNYIDEAFMLGLFNGLSITQDQENFYSIIKIITHINQEYSIGSQKTKIENIFLKTYYYHEKAGILIEGMIRILNIDPDKEVKCRILQCFYDLLKSSPVCVMYSCDLESFIDVSIKILESTYTTKLRLYLLKVLEKLTRFDEYYKLKYKYVEMIEILESYIEHEDIGEKCRELCLKTLENIKSCLN
jgi:hypothetical protein